jgi:hypothetical protein
MAEKLFYYLLTLSLVGGFFLVYNGIVTELRSRRERRERERLRLAYAEIKRLKVSKSTEQLESTDVQGYDSEQAFGDDTLGCIRQLQNEINQRVVELEREL